MIRKPLFEEMAEKYPWFKELLKKTPFERIDKDLGEYIQAYRWLCEGRIGWPTCYIYHAWMERQKKLGKLEYWYKLFGLEKKWKELQEREARDEREREERSSRIRELIKRRKAEERAAYDAIVGNK